MFANRHHRNKIKFHQSAHFWGASGPLCGICVPGPSAIWLHQLQKTSRAPGWQYNRWHHQKLFTTSSRTRYTATSSNVAYNSDDDIRQTEWTEIIKHSAVNNALIASRPTTRYTMMSSTGRVNHWTTIPTQGWDPPFSSFPLLFLSLLSHPFFPPLLSPWK